ncbi:hypothetical protein I858_009080 [Planococcus versutus]|uniref:Uncharacterized protein n=1 Tax=Planococcus versutus TaxID=1302659 RepID=A0A1B1S1S1_9BACL|nr:hypothetical protein I858_009080 [Planococcus versutus]
MKLYKELDKWWPLMSQHTESKKKPVFFEHHGSITPISKTQSSLVSDGGSNAFYLKNFFNDLN